MNTATDLAAPLTPARPQALSAAADSDQARAVAEVQAQMIMAKRYPRNEIQARDKILNACMRKGLAEVASYDFARGGSKVTGPSIRLLEVMAAAWGNMVTGWRELSRQNGVSEIEAYAWDLESNTRWPLTFQVKHWRDTKGGGYLLTDERDIYELCANMAARRVRACIEKLIPGDIIDDAVTQCEQTLLSKANVTPEHIKRTVEAFMQYNVTPEMIETKIQRRIDSITAPQVVQLGKIFNSLRDGMSKPEDWFDMSAAKGNVVDAKVADEKKPDAKKKASDKPSAKTNEKVDPQTGEVTEGVAQQNKAPPADAQTSGSAPSLNFGE